MDNQSERKYGPILSFFANNPAIGAAGSLASIVGVILSVIFFTASIQKRDLRYCVNPAKAIVVKTGQSSRIRVTLEGAAVDRDVTAAQVAFWNEGGQSIFKSNMLEPLVIRTGPNAPVLEARVRKTSRGVSGIKLDLSKIDKGEVQVNWTILERFDGGVVQLIYMGDVNTPISATGIVEGQDRVHALDFEGTPEWKTILFLFYGIIFMMTIIDLIFGMKIFVKSPYLKLILILAWALMTLYLIFGAKPGPPFGF